jgi:hypothetical protein
MLGEPKTVVAELLRETDLFDGFAIGLGLAATWVKPWDAGQDTHFHVLCLTFSYRPHQPSRDFWMPFRARIGGVRWPAGLPRRRV